MRKGILKCGIPVACHKCNRGGDPVGLKARARGRQRRLGSILNEIATHSEANPNWLNLSTAL